MIERRWPKSRGVLAVVIGVLVVAAVFVGGWWAASATFGSRSAREVDGVSEMAEAREGTVGRVFNFGLTIQVPSAAVAINALSGVVTEVGDGEAEQGSVLYAVGNQPVFAVRGDTPFYRDLAEGSTGDDVKMLQAMLKDTGVLAGDVDGVFGSTTSAAMKKHEKALGFPTTGRAPLGSLVAFAHLPVPVTFMDGFRAGQVLAGGEEVVSAPAGDRTFTVSVADAQKEFVPAGATVTFTYGGQQFTGIVEDVVEKPEQSQVTATLAGVDGGSVCDTRCAVLPAAPTTSVLAEVRPEEAVDGIVVPAAAVISTAQGQAFVNMADGTRREVTVRGSGQGLVVVDGIEAGQQVRLGSGAATGTSSDEPSPASTSSPAR